MTATVHGLGIAAEGRHRTRLAGDWRRAVACWLCGTLALLLGLLPAAAAQAPPAATLHFAAPALGAPLALGGDVLSPQERAFVAGLPEIRVGLPLPAVRPYEVIGDDGAVTGIHAEMLGYVARALGLRLRPVLLPDFVSLLQAAERREIDLVMTLGFTPDRARYLAYTLGVTPLPGALFARTSTPAQPASETDIERARFAVERGFQANHFIRRQFPHAQILSVETTDQALRAVAEGRADYYLGALLTTIDWLSRTPVPGIEVRRLMNYGTGYYHFAVRKDWAPLAAVLNKAISALRVQGVGGPESPAWRAAAASLPGGVPMPQPLRLDAGELALLSQRPVWRVGAVRGLPLLNHLEPDGQHTGIAAEATEQVARRLGVGIQVVGFDSVGLMLDALRRGEIDLVPFLTRTPEREREFAYSIPYVDMPYVIVARSDAPLYWSLDSLRGRRLALALQHPLRPLLRQRYPDIGLVDVADGNAALDAVADRLADAAVEVKLFANLRINGDGDDRLRTVAVVDELPAQFHFATLAADAARLALVDRALADIPPDERLRMRRRWVAVDLDPPFPWRRWRPALLTAATSLLLLAAASGWWMRRLAREAAARRRSEQRLLDIAANVPAVAFRYVFDAAGQPPRAAWVSPRAPELLGLQPAADRTLLAALDAHADIAPAEALAADEQRALAGDGRLQRSFGYRHPDGRRLWLSCEAVRTPAEGSRLAWTGYLVDASKEHQLQQQLVQAAQSRNLMLAAASHELRAPAHMLALALQALTPQGLPPVQQRALRCARDAVETLSQLLSDVLDAARFDGAPLRLQARDFDLRELLSRIGESAAAHAASKGLAFEVSVDPALPACIHLDPLRLRQVIVNLLSNAIKYNVPQGRVTLSLSRVQPGPEAAQGLLVEVADTGPGIDAALQERLFTPFASARWAAPREGSSGLGLTISRQLAQAMGGRLTLHSAPGQGTRISVLLPLRAAAAPPDRAARQGVVLVCDDDATSRMLLVQLLQARGFEVEEAEQAEAALERCRRGGVAALITDLQMPGLDGLGLLRRLHAEAAAGLLSLPARVVCSGDSADADADAGPLRDLADARLVKPVDLALLLQTLHALGVQPLATA